MNEFGPLANVSGKFADGLLIRPTDGPLWPIWPNATFMLDCDHRPSRWSPNGK